MPLWLYRKYKKHLIQIQIDCKSREKESLNFAFDIENLKIYKCNQIIAENQIYRSLKISWKCSLQQKYFYKFKYIENYICF